VLAASGQARAEVVGAGEAPVSRNAVESAFPLGGLTVCYSARMADLGPVAWPPEPIRTERLVLREPEARDRAAAIELLASWSPVTPSD
jgi:hypothetical protein